MYNNDLVLMRFDMRLTHFLLVTTVLSLSTPAWAMEEDKEEDIQTSKCLITNLSREERAKLQNMWENDKFPDEKNTFESLNKLRKDGNLYAGAYLGASTLLKYGKNVTTSGISDKEILKETTNLISHRTEKIDKKEKGFLFNIVGHFYNQEIGVEQNTLTAVLYFKKAIKWKNSTAMLRLAELYKVGKAVKKKPEKTIRLYERAIELGNTLAMNYLSYMYQYGEGVEKNILKAIQLNERASKLGNAAAMNNLAYIYRLGEGVEIDFQKALQLYERASKLGHATAMCNLAIIYESGEGVEINLQKALQLYEISAKKGISEAQKRLPLIKKEIEHQKKKLQERMDKMLLFQKK
jgi:TPR repeat protein